jgi:hypothetical protein
MSKFTSEWLNQYVLKRNDQNQIQDTKPQCVVLNEPLAEKRREENGSARVVVCIESRRVRLIDLDNLYGGAKFLIDAARYKLLIKGDSAKDIDLQIFQTKVAKGEEETILTITYP